jgi:hypothetical protein
MSANFIILGTTDNVHTCAHCGRKDLVKAVALVQSDVDGNVIDQPFYVGTTCAAHLTGRKAQFVARKAADADGRTIVGNFGSWAWTAKGTTITVKNIITGEASELSKLRPKLAANIVASVAAKRGA